MKCAETRKTPYGIKRRRYKRTGLDDLTTYEIPESVVRAIGMKRIAETMAKWRRGDAHRELSAYRKEFVRQRIGWKPAAIAHDLGLSDARIRQIIKEIHAEQASQRDARGDAGRTQLREVHRDPADHGRDG